MSRGPQLAPRLAALVVFAVITVASSVALGSLAPAAQASRLVQGLIVSATPSSITPEVYDGQVSAVVTVGERVIVGGTFTKFAQLVPYTGFTRSFLFAFDRNTGVVDPGFVPVLDGPVEALEPSPDGGSVYVAGNFGTVNGVASRSLARLDVVTGTAVPGFDAVTSGAVHDIALSGGKLYVGGNFWVVNGVPKTRLAAVDALTGALDPNFTIATTQPRVSVDWIDKITVSPLGTEMIITGNFMAIDGQPRAQIARIDLTGPSPTLMPWSTQRFAPICAAAFWTYVRDVEYSPAGDSFAVVTTGGPGGTATLCDSTSRWETANRSPNAVETWVDYTGGDTLTAVAVSDVAIYIGGHARWTNNHLGSNTAGPGAVARSGIAALDPINGVPLTWNPGMNRNIAVWDLDLTDRGLYVGSDSDYFAGQYHPKLAQFPLVGGTAPPVARPDTLPTTLYTGQAAVLTTRSFSGTTFGTAATLVGSPINWSTVADAFVEAGKLYYVDGTTLRSRTFDGTTFGAAVTEPSWTAWPNVTAATWFNGRLYYVESTSNALKYRYFSLQSGIVGSQTFTVTDGISWSGIAAMDVVGDQLYYAKTDGNLWRVRLVNGVPSAATQTLVSGPATGDGRTWANSALFFLSTDQPPTVSITAPANGSTVSGTVPITAAAADDLGVASVAFTVNGTALGTDTTAADGWSTSFDTTTIANGSATITATVTDSAGKTATASVTVTVQNTVVTGGDVLYVVGNPGALLAGEIAVRDRLTSAGRSVTILDDNLTTPVAATGYAMVLVGSSVSTGVLGSTLKNLAQAVWLAKPYLLDDMGVTGPVALTDYGFVSTATVDIVDSSHPLAGGLTGSVTVTSAAREASYGVPGAAAQIVARIGTRPTTFVYRPGATLADGTPAAGCRLTSSVFQDGPTQFTAAGWTLFDAAVTYALAGCPPSTPPPTGQVALVVGSPGSLTAGEAAISARLSGLGFVVEVLDDNTATAAGLVGKAFVLISSSVASNVVQATFRDVSVPVWVAKPYLLDDMGMTGTNATVDYGAVFGGDASISTPAHPMAAGRSGTVTISQPSTDQSFGVPAAAATIVATVAGKPVSFVYRSGTVLASGASAAGCRIHLSAYLAAPAAFTADGWALFDATARYAAAACPAG